MKKLAILLLTALTLSVFVSTNAKADSASGGTFSVTKDAAPTTVGTNSNIAFSITIKNISNASAAPLEVTDTLPAGFTYNNDAKLTNLAGTQTNFTPTIAGQTLKWAFDGDSLISVPANQNIVISFTAKTPTTAGQYTNQACLTQPENVCATANFTVQTTTPNTGIVENVLILSLTGILIILIAVKVKKGKRNFEESVLSRI